MATFNSYCVCARACVRAVVHTHTHVCLHKHQATLWISIDRNPLGLQLSYLLVLLVGKAEVNYALLFQEHNMLSVWGN